MADDSDRADRSEGTGEQPESPSAGEVAPEPSSTELIGQIVSHYRVESRVGRGGMGVVYRASDLRLDRQVALKFLPPLLHNDEVASERFVAEARAASALDHPNICTIFEIGEAETGQTFIAMALYEGETLKEKIGRGPLSVDEAVDYTIQMARGLSKAHEAGIVHRDIKPANIIVTPDGIAKILDFGLARTEDQQLTRTGEILGTLDYMSPEQVQGETAEAQSDVWSVGAILYEMLTGKRPFKSGNQAAVLYSVVYDEPEDISVTNPAVPGELADIVQTCLEKDVTRRYRDAGTLLTHLDPKPSPAMRGVGPAADTPGRTRGIEAPVAARSPATTRPSGRLMRPGLRTGALALAAVAALVLVIPTARGWVGGLFSPEPALARTSTLAAVIPSSGGTADDEILAEGLTHVLTGELARLGSAVDSFSVLSSTEILNQDVRTARQIYEIYGANRILTISISRIVGAPRVTVALVDPTSLNELGRATLPLPDSMGTAFQDSVSVVLAGLMGLTLSTADAGSAPADAKAFQYYSRGLGYLARYADPGNLDDAFQLFESALAEDSLFAPAWAGLCEVQFRRFQNTNDTSYVAQAQPSCDEAERLGEDQVEVLVPVASLYLQTGYAEEALRMLSAAAASDPGNASVHHWLARAHEELGHANQARTEFEAAIRLDPILPIYHSDFASHLIYNGQHAEAIEHLKEMMRLAPDNFFGPLGLSGSYILMDSLRRAEAILTPLIVDANHPRVFSNLGYLYLQQGRFAEAIDVLERGQQAYPGDMWIPRWLAQGHYFQGDSARARASWRRVIQIADPLLAVDRSDEDALGALAEAYANLGQREQAQRYADLLAAEPKLWDYNVYYLGRTLERLGSREAAIRRIEDALERNYPRAIVDRDPWLEDLRRDPRYTEMVDQASDR